MAGRQPPSPARTLREPLRPVTSGGLDQVCLSSEHRAIAGYAMFGMGVYWCYICILYAEERKLCCGCYAMIRGITSELGSVARLLQVADRPFFSRGYSLQGPLLFDLGLGAEVLAV